MSNTLPQALVRRLRDEATRAAAIAEVSQREDLLSVLFARPDQLATADDRRRWDRRGWYRRAVLFPCLAAARALPETVEQWASAQVSLTWAAEDGPLDRIPLPHLANLRELSLIGLDIDPAMLPRRARVEHLHVTKGALPEDLSGLAEAFPHLRSLALHEVPITRVTGLARLAELTSLTLRDTPLRALGPLPALTSLALQCCRLESLDDIALPASLVRLDLSGNPDLSDVSRLRELDRLAELDVSSCTSLRSLEPIARERAIATRVDDAGLATLRGAGADAKGQLALNRLAALTSLDGLDPRVRSLRIDYCDALESLGGAHETLEDLSISGCKQLRSLAGIERCTKLARAHFFYVAVTDLSPLATLPALVAVDAQYNSSIASLGELAARPNVRAITLEGTHVKRKDVPAEHRWKCSWARGARIDEMLAAPPPEPAAALPKDAKKRLSALRTMLKTSDPASLDQAIELCAALGDPALYDALLARVKYVHFRRTRHLGEGYTLEGSGFSGPAGVYAMIGLIATAPDASERAHALRSEIASLNLLAQRTSEGNAPVRPAHLARLPELRHVTLSRVGPIRIDETPEWPALRSITLHEVGGVGHLRWLEGASDLERVHLFGMGTTLSPLSSSVREVALSQADLRLDRLAGWNLESLIIGYRSRVNSWHDIADLNALKRLEGPKEIMPIAATLPQLEELRLRGGADLSPLAGHPSLRILYVEGGPYAGLDALERIPTLEKVMGAVPPEVRARYP